MCYAALLPVLQCLVSVMQLLPLCWQGRAMVHPMLLRLGSTGHRSAVSCNDIMMGPHERRLLTRHARPYILAFKALSACVDPPLLTRVLRCLVTPHSLGGRAVCAQPIRAVGRGAPADGWVGDAR